MVVQSAEHKQPGSSIADQLSQAYNLLQEQQTQEALAVIKDVKALEPRNIYVLAFEKQIEQLVQLSESRTLTEEQRTDIMDSIPGIIERAVEGAAVEQLTAERAQKPAGVGRDDRAAALEWLKDQYFQHAHEYVQAGKYDHALAEIRRVHIIDPGNTTALEFERRIEHLARLRKEPPPQSTPLLRLVTRESLKIDDDAEAEPEAPPEPPPPPAAIEPEPVPQYISEPARTEIVAREKPAPTAEPPQARRGVRPMVIVLFLLAVVAAGATAYFFWTQRQADKRAEQRRAVAIATQQGESFIGPSATVDQRVFVLSTEGDSKSPTPVVEQESPEPSAPVTPPKPTRTAAKKESPREKSRSTTNVNEKPAPEPRPEPLSVQPNPVTRAVQEPETKSAPPQVTEEAPPSKSIAEKQPEIIKLEPIQFTQGTSGQSFEGEAVVQVQIDASGKPVGTRVLSSSNPLIIQPIINAVMKSRFSPALMSSGPVTSWMTIPFKFTKR